jgi:hypothetical protein
MAKWTKETVEELLEDRMKETAARLKAKGFKTSSGDLARNLAPLVIALMSDSRRREVGRLLKDESGPAVIDRWLVTKLKDRYQDLKVMSELLWKVAKKR